MIRYGFVLYQNLLLDFYTNVLHKKTQHNWQTLHGVIYEHVILMPKFYFEIDKYAGTK